MTDVPTERDMAAAVRTVASLDQQAVDLRAELRSLRNHLVEVQSELSASQAHRLQEANQKLVFAVLEADRIAEAAVLSLAKLRDSNQHDGLTGVPNRVLGLDRLASAIEMAHRHGTRLAVLFLDLDHFKAINDQLGHATGDEILRLASLRLRSVLRDSDTICRYGGDEFLLLLPDIAQTSDAGRIAAELLAALSKPHRVGQHELQPSASIGISMYPDDGDNAATLIDCADAAMYRRKRRGAGGFQFHTEQDAARERADTSANPLSPAATMHSAVTPAATPHQHDLREANTHLVMASLVAQESELKATQAQQQQMKFMAMVAHELRNPLTPLRLATDMLTDHGAGHETPIEKLAGIISNQVAHMTRLIEDLLDGSRLGTGKLRLEFVKLDLVGVVAQVILACQPAMQTRQQCFSFELPTGPLYVRGDPIRLAQVFNNLLDNARKYTPEGGEISLRMTVTAPSVSISVQDNGQGISSNMLPLVFDLFVQDARVLPHSNGGLGIGLAVVRELVEAHGGTVVGHSAGRDLGSEFVVTLPLS